MNINSLGMQHLNVMNSLSPANLPTANSGSSSFPSMPPTGLNANLGAAGHNPLSGSDFADLMRRSRAPSTDDGSSLQRVPDFVQDKQLFEASLELETILVQNLIRGMRNTIQRTNLIDTGFAGEIYEDMLFEEYARIITRNAGFGFAEMAYRELSGLR